MTCWPRALALSLWLLPLACAAPSPSPSPADASTTTPPLPDAGDVAGRFRVDVWADNWFALWVGEVKVGEDSVPITTERSFNAERLTFAGSRPLTLNFVVKDYTQNETGLEYIGLPNQQMGDGGFIFQLVDLATGKVVAVSSRATRCLVIDEAPLNPACEKAVNPSQTCLSRRVPEPAGWRAPGFDASAWEAATVYTAAQVGPKDGYFSIAWDPAAQFVWTANRKADNTLLCMVTVP